MDANPWLPGASPVCDASSFRCEERIPKANEEQDGALPSLAILPCTSQDEKETLPKSQHTRSSVWNALQTRGRPIRIKPWHQGELPLQLLCDASSILLEVWRTQALPRLHPTPCAALGTCPASSAGGGRAVSTRQPSGETVADITASPCPSNVQRHLRGPTAPRPPTQASSSVDLPRVGAGD